MLKPIDSIVSGLVISIPEKRGCVAAKLISDTEIKLISYHDFTASVVSADSKAQLFATPSARSVMSGAGLVLEVSHICVFYVSTDESIIVTHLVVDGCTPLRSCKVKSKVYFNVM